MSCRIACLQDGIYFRMMCLTGIHVLQEDRFYLRVCLIGGHRLYVIGVHISVDDLSYKKTHLSGG